MSHNIYQSPNSTPPPNTPNGLGSGDSRKAIPFTLIFDYGYTHLLSFFLAAVITSYHTSKGKTVNEVMVMFEQTTLLSPLNLVFMAMGLCVTFTAGYKCAKWSVRNVWRDIIVVMVISQVIDTYLYFESLAFWEYLLLTLLDTVVMVLGVNHWIKQNRHHWKP